MTKDILSYGVLFAGIAGMLGGVRMINGATLAGWLVLAIGLAVIYGAYRMMRGSSPSSGSADGE